MTFRIEVTDSDGHRFVAEPDVFVMSTSQDIQEVPCEDGCGFVHKRLGDRAKLVLRAEGPIGSQRWLAE